ncbi:glycosyltransferase family 1 protein [Tautonia sp. JC769]|uniref:glycosyltransferase n=1 Tax=Tautonia sp. JC769 TaxID=3232135 RepID=UPI00345AB22F
MALRIVHFSTTRLAGGPWRLVKATREHSPHDVRLVDQTRWGVYPHDVVHDEQPELALELAEQADIIHFHNYLDYQSEAFRPIDFEALRRKGKAFVRQFRSDAPLIARRMGIPIEQLIWSPIPSIVIAQYPERFFPQARVVPNVVPINDHDYLPADEPVQHDLLFTPTRRSSAWATRWATKGFPETVEMMQRVARRSGCSMRVINGRPLSEVLAAKNRCRLVLDDMITGSYHVSGIEALSKAKPVLCFLDPRIETVLRQISGAFQSPFINARLEEAEAILVELLRHPEALRELGQEGRTWVERYWSPASTIAHYLEVYESLLRDPTSVRRQESLRIDGPARRFLAFDMHDQIYQARAEHHRESVSRSFRAARAIRSSYRHFRDILRRLRLRPQRSLALVSTLPDAKH